eukprot:jgi/Ulvmu1/10397/UM061_0081.1
MGFFSAFKRNKNQSSAAEGACNRSLSLYPHKHDASQNGEEFPLQASAAPSAKSFSFASVVKSQNQQQEDRNRRRTQERITAAAAEKITYSSISQLSNLVELYKGSISTVYRAKCVESGARVVVKMYHKEKMTPKQMHKLKREIDIQTLVRDCPYVCQLLAHFEDEEKKYLILEHCAGGDLFKRMLKQGNLTEARVCTDVIVPLLRVLESLDTLNILHRDIKPENIFLSHDDQIRLGDFGLAIDITKEIPFCRSGTLDYMAPEVLINPCTRLEEQDATPEQLSIRNIVPYSSKVDVWATGVLAFELVTGRPPFEVDNESETVKLILTSDDIKYPSWFSSEWASFVRTVLNKKPRHRPSASMLLEHPWVVKNMAKEVGAPVRRPEIECLLEPIPIYHIESSENLENKRKASMEELVDLSNTASTSRSLRFSESAHSPRSPTSSIRHLGGRGAVSFSVPSEKHAGVSIFQLSQEEKGETGAAVGMKARLQLYMNRQRL